MLRFGVVVDPQPNGRLCFWKSFLKAAGHNCQLICIPEILAEGSHPNLRDLDVLVVNWDAANGVSLHKSDITAKWLSDHRDRIIEFVQWGGVLIAEAQCFKWRPLQSAYDALFGRGNLEVYDDTLEWGNEVWINKSFRDHPLLLGLPERLRSDPPAALPKIWHPGGIATPQTEITTYPQKAYNGWFAKFDPAYFPLLLDQGRHHPVLLCRSRGAGLEIATTMFIASARLNAVLDGIVRGRSQASIYTVQRQARRRIARLELYLLFLASMLSITFLQNFGVINVGIPFTLNENIWNLVISIAGSLLATGLVFIGSLVTRHFREMR